MLRICRVRAASGIFLFGDPVSLLPIPSPLTYFPERTLAVQAFFRCYRSAGQALAQSSRQLWP